VPPVPTPDPDAETASTFYRRGQAALRDERLDEAVIALNRAVEMAPDDHDFKCALAWARFCKAGDKSRIADSTRATLSQAALRGDKPVVAYYYLGMVERILGRTPQAMTAFQHVLDLDPDHREANTELRFLSRNSGPIKR
jgi:cytochrome c-type biogenesis protein CcmH/NrfG